MKEHCPTLHQRIAGRARELRAASSLSIESLASRSGVSRSMISLIERGECSPTAVVLEKLAVGLGVSLPALFDAPEATTPASPISRHAEQSTWRDPASGYVRRNLSPLSAATRLQIVEVLFPAGKRVAFESGPRQSPLHQQIWMIEGAIDITIGKTRHRLKQGDCLAMELDGPTIFHNPTRKRARYLVAVTPENRVVR